MKKRIGLMGCGKVAQYGHLSAIAACPDLTLHAAYDPNPAARQWVEEHFPGVRTFGDEDAFFSSGIEAVSITSPAPCHYKNVVDAVSHRLAVICEKPLAATAVEAAAMINAARTARVPLYTAFCYRFSQSALDIRNFVRSKVIGEVRTLRLIYNWHLHGKYETGPDGSPVISPRRTGRMIEGGPLVDCGTHQIDLALFWLDSPVTSFTGHGSWVDTFEAPDHGWVHMNHSNGAHTVIEISYTYHHTAKNRHEEFVYELIGTEGVIRYDRTAQSFTIENGEGLQVLPFHAEKNFNGMYDEFARALQSGSSDLLPDGGHGMEVIRIARQATDQAIKNRVCAG